MPKPVNDVLYHVPLASADAARQEIVAAGGRSMHGPRDKDWMAVPTPQRTYQLNLVHSDEEAFARIGTHYYDFVVVDARVSRGGDLARMERFIEKIHIGSDPDLRCPAARIIAVLETSSDLADRAFALGRQRIGGFVVDPFSSGALFDKMEQLIDPDPGKAAICLAGGGVEGFLFEIGVMKALNAHLQSRSVTDFDIFCGISAGAILAAFMANRAEPEDIEAGFLNPQGPDNVEPVTPAVIYDPDIREYGGRLWRLLSSVPVNSWSEIISDLLKSVPAGFFQGEALRRFVEKQLTRAGRTNDFRQLERELYIGATDQDTSTHVVFGAGQWRDIPISTAVRASTALTPFFTPAKIRGRYFVDGQYTRTSNFHVAIERGAKLVVIVDPLVPVRVDLPGYVRKKGGVFCGLQALKAVIHTRFMRSFQKVAETHPQVDFLLFLPEGNDVRLMSGSPMKYNIRTEILNMAYRSAVRRIQRDFEVVHGSFAKHGFQLQRHPRMRSPYRRVC